MEHTSFRADTVYISVVLLIFALLMWIGMVDFILYHNAEETISEWLKKHPRWIIYPFSLLLVFIGVMLIHIFTGDI